MNRTIRLYVEDGRVTHKSENGEAQLAVVTYASIIRERFNLYFDFIEKFKFKDPNISLSGIESDGAWVISKVEDGVFGPNTVKIRKIYVHNLNMASRTLEFRGELNHREITLKFVDNVPHSLVGKKFTIFGGGVTILLPSTLTKVEDCANGNVRLTFDRLGISTTIECKYKGKVTSYEFVMPDGTPIFAYCE